MCWSLTHMWWIKICEGYLRSEESQPHTKPPTQDSCARKVSPHNLWMQNPSGIELVEETSGAPGSSLKTHKWTHLLRVTTSELQHKRGSLEGTSGILGEAEVSCIGTSKNHCPFSEPSPHRAMDLADRCHI